MMIRLFILAGLIWCVIPVSKSDSHHHYAMLAHVVNTEINGKHPQMVRGLEHDVANFAKNLHGSQVALGIPNLPSIPGFSQHDRNSYLRAAGDLNVVVTDVHKRVDDVVAHKFYVDEISQTFSATSRDLAGARAQLSSASMSLHLEGPGQNSN